MKSEVQNLNSHSFMQRPWAREAIAWLFPLFCVISCNESKDNDLAQKLYFDPQGDKSEGYVEGGIQIEYNKNDLTKFAVSSSTLTTYTHLLYSVKNHTISGVHVTIKNFVDSAGNISYDSPAEVKTQTIDFKSTKQQDNHYKTIGCDAWRAIIQSITEDE